jgi:hypothetical protein
MIIGSKVASCARRFLVGISGLVGLSTVACGSGDPLPGAAEGALAEQSQAVTLGSRRTQGHTVTIPGSILLTWNDNYSPETGYTGATNIWNARIDDAGNMIGAPRRLAPTNKAQSNPSVAYGAQVSEAMLVWDEVDYSTTSDGVWTAKGLVLDATGVPLGSPFALWPARTAYGPHVAFDPTSYYFMVAAKRFVSASGTAVVYVNPSGNVCCSFPITPGSSFTGAYDMDMILAGGKMTTMQVTYPSAYDYFGYIEPFEMRQRRTLLAGQYLYGPRMMYSAASDMLGTMFYTGVAKNFRNFHEVQLKLMPHTGCFIGETCAAVNVVLRSTPIPTVDTTYNKYEYAGAVVGGKFVAAVRTELENVGNDIVISSVSSSGVIQKSTTLTSSCKVREVMGVATAVNNTWVFWTCENAEIRGRQIGADSSLLSAEKVVVP